MRENDTALVLAPGKIAGWKRYLPPGGPPICQTRKPKWFPLPTSGTLLFPSCRMSEAVHSLSPPRTAVYVRSPPSAIASIGRRLKGRIRKTNQHAVQSTCLRRHPECVAVVVAATSMPSQTTCASCRWDLPFGALMHPGQRVDRCLHRTTLPEW